MKSNYRKMGKNSAEWIDDVLNSLDGIERANANPFLYTRIAARIDKQFGTWERVAFWLGKPSLAIGAIVVFLAINITVIMWGQKQSEKAWAQQNISEQLLASEFTNNQSYQLVEINEEK